MTLSVREGEPIRFSLASLSPLPAGLLAHTRHVVQREFVNVEEHSPRVDGVHALSLADIAPTSARSAELTVRHGESGIEDTKTVSLLDYSGERVPSVRELAVELAVNPNTVVRTFEHLTDEQVIKNQRGVGYFATEDAIERVKKIMRDEFFDKNLPDLIRQMELLDLKIEDLRPFFEEKMAAKI